MTFDIDSLLGPGGLEGFLKNALGRDAFYVKGLGLSHLMSWPALNQLLTYGGIAHPRLRLINGDQELPSVMYSNMGSNGYPQLNVRELTGCLREGALLAIDGIESLYEPISQFCDALARSLCIPVYAELYASWPNMRLRPPKWNDHETLLLQIDGHKTWRVFPPTTHFPTANYSQSAPLGEPSWQGTLCSGDLLYIPRGWWYSDNAPQVPALYLAAKFRVPRGSNLLRHVVAQAHMSEIMRMDVPVLGGISNQGSYLTAFQRELVNLLAQPGLMLGFLKDPLESSVPRTHFSLPWTVAAEPLPPAEDWVVFSLLRFPRAEKDRRWGIGDAISLLHNGRKLYLSHTTMSILERTCGPSPVTVGGLIEQSREELSRSEVLGALSELIRHGLVAAQEPNRTRGESQAVY